MHRLPFYEFINKFRNLRASIACNGYNTAICNDKYIVKLHKTRKRAVNFYVHVSIRMRV